MKVNLELSHQLAEEVKATRSNCWHNAWVGLYEAMMNGAVYVEGWVINPIGLIDQHGWLELDGEIIDPTYCLWEEGFDRVVYFPGLRFDRETARRETEHETDIMEPGLLPYAWRYGLEGMDSPEYMAARAAVKAYRAAQQEAEP